MSTAESLRTPADPIALLLASGSGRRFDATGRRNKLTEPLANGQTVLASSARQLLAAGLVVIVIAPIDRVLRSALEDLPVAWCDNREPERGMGHSIALGVAAHPSPCGWLVALGDMPFIRVDTILQIAKRLRQPNVSIVAPFIGTQRGHPVGFAASLRNALCALDGDQGARALFTRYPVTEVASDDCGILRDIDRPEDLSA